MKPTIHLTNWSSRKLHGPGRKLSIMARPRAWEHGDGRVAAFVPDARDLAAVRAGTIDVAEYRRRCEALFQRERHWPGMLVADDQSLGMDEVRDGDTLLCACSREAAARGECHRVWAAAALARAGWRVVLDGTEVTP